jgi:hypothetical protein
MRGNKSAEILGTGAVQVVFGGIAVIIQSIMAIELDMYRKCIDIVRKRRNPTPLPTTPAAK